MNTWASWFTTILLLSISLPLMGQKRQGSYRNWVLASDRKEKIALVLANEAYAGQNRLEQPINDAEVIAQALKNDGYDVLVGYNLEKLELEEVILEFATKFQDYQQGLLFYAGHGFQIGGNNYLIPIGAKPNQAREVDFYCTDLNRIFRILDEPDKEKIVILDACRNHDFLDKASFYNSTEKEGFAQVRAIKKSLVIYSTAPDTEVKDDNPFTEALAQRISKGGCIYPVLADVAADVELLDPTQIVWHEGNLGDDFCFGKQPAPAIQIDTNEAPIDTDKDGVPDDQDQCPEEKGLPETGGCPVFNAFKWRKVRKREQPGSLVSCNLDTMPSEFTNRYNYLQFQFYESFAVPWDDGESPLTNTNGKFPIDEPTDRMVPEDLYIQKFKDIAMREMERTGIPASIKLAQGILESNAGQSTLARNANNHFGIKCGSTWDGNTYYAIADDYNAQGEVIESCFRGYQSPEASFIAHSEYLRDPAKSFRYSFLFRLDPEDYRGWSEGLRRAGYATNPNYPELLIGIIERYNLTRYDQPEREIVEPQYHTVLPGETLYFISRKYGLTIDALKRLNQLEENIVRVGQKLRVK